MFSRELDNPIRVRPMYPPEYVQPQYGNIRTGKQKNSRTGKNKKGSAGKKELWFREYCEETSLHGLKYLVKPGSPKYERAYWILALLATYTVLHTTLWEQWMDYKSPVLISFDPEPTVISSLPLPAITLCPDMQVRSSFFNLSSTFADDHNATEKEKDLLYLSTTFCGIYFHDRDVPAGFSLETMKNFSLAHNTYNQCLDFITFASLAFRKLEDPCYYFQPTFTEQGACFSFNLLPPTQIYNLPKGAGHEKFPGSEHQAALGRESVWSPDDGYQPPSMKQIRPRKDGNPPLAASQNAVSAGYAFMLQVPSLKFDSICHGGMGFHGYIHNPAEPPTNEHTYFYVGPAEEIDFKIEPKVNTINRDLLKWPPSTRKCYMQYERPLAFFKFYTQRNCEMECESNFTAKKCNCVPFYRPRSIDQTVCGPRFRRCLANHSEDNEDLNCNCLPGCSEIEYLGSYTTLKKTWTDYHITKTNFSFDGALFMSVKLSYRTKYLQSIVRNPAKMFVDFVADVGGLLSLFTGFSILSLMEVIYFVFKRKNKKPATPALPKLKGPYVNPILY